MKMLKKLCKYTLVTLAIIAGTSVCLAQSNSQTLKFEEESWNFGKIKETDGPVSHVFRFTNNTSKPIIIERVSTDCGCTVPKYSSEPVRPGQSGSIEVVFDPTGYNGNFTKAVSVFSGNGKIRCMLTVTGNVIARELSVEETFPYAIAGGVRADNLYVAFEYIANNVPTSMTVNIVNTSNKKAAISVVDIDGSGHLKVNTPATLAPGERGAITLTYNLSAKNPVYGMLSDRVRLAVNGTASDMIISAHAIAIDDFSNIDHSHTPDCYINPVFHNFGRVAFGETPTKEISISNTGTAPLIIRNVTPRAGTECSLKSGTEIAPGKTTRFNITMKTGNKTGIITGGATLITNDPERPMRDIRTAIEVIK